MKVKTTRIFAFIIAFVLLTLTACSNRSKTDSSASSVPSQSESTLPSSSSTLSSEQQNQSTPSEESPPLDEDGPFKAFADELRDTYHDELVDILNQVLNEHRNGTFQEIPNHHPPYPSDFPLANNLPVIESIKDIVIVWRESVMLNANTKAEGAIFIIVPIDESHIYILEPSLFSDADDKTSLGFANSSFANLSTEDFIAQSETQSFPDGL